MLESLPPEVARNANLRGNEYAWTIATFPDAVADAEAADLACLGGQFQFRLDDGTTYEMYWLNADSRERDSGEAWADYVHRSCAEVRANFEKLILTTDFAKEALNWQIRVDVNSDLVFVAYFVTEAALAEISAQRNS